ncbi:MULTISPECIES: hypothetical protein [Streptomyces]|uniref:Integral membrane protein n=1 Tax=Streptomyces edwardsiae TaxID=3075527 RepID=A0ABU2Q2M2_9ACTN|nr:hypothetical protein [Streptomyces sp. DSM 41636]MDT0398672.1 hypothetical protein [Streptomyces sp. DSM 41636]
MQGFVAAGVLGALVGTAELMSRYRDRPSALLGVASAWFYVLLNAAASGGVLWLIRTFDWRFGSTSADQTAALQVLVAGLAALALFRSALFNVRIGDQEVGVGPNLILAMLLGVADRGVDRVRAKDRSQQVTRIMRGVRFARARVALPAFCLALLQNLPEQEQQDLATAVESLDASEMTDTQKSYALGLLLINIVGPDVLEGAVTALGEEIGEPRTSPGHRPQTRGRPDTEPLTA